MVNQVYLKGGLVLFETLSGVNELSVQEIFAYRFSQNSLLGIDPSHISENKNFSEIRISKKPVKLSFRVGVHQKDLTIAPIYKGAPLTSEQITSCFRHGYFINGKHLFSIMPEETAELANILGASKLKHKLKYVSDLRRENLLEKSTENLVGQLIESTDSLLEVERNGSFLHKLYPYQRSGVHWLLYCTLNNIGSLLGDDMGLGKTAQIIALIAEGASKQLFERVVIVVPNSLLENWRREFKFFYPGITPYLHSGSPRVGLASILSKYKVILMPYSVMSADIEMLVDLQIDVLVFDEASLLKNPESARTIAASRLNSSTTIAMTGTPVENSLLDIWSVINIIYPSYLGLKDDFTRRYIERDISATLENDLSELETSISQIMLRRMKSDILADLPEKIDIHQPIIMTKMESECYEEIVNDIRNSESTGANVLTEIIKLQQFTSHPSLIPDYVINHSPKTLINQSAKYERLIELLNNIKAMREKVLIFVNHIAMIDLLKESLGEIYNHDVHSIDGRVEATERQQVIDAFSNINGYSVLVLNPRTAGMGLNITTANHVIHYSRQWNPALEEQATARAFRNGQTKEVNVYYLYYAGTIEEIIDERLRLKKELADAVVSVVDEKADELEFYLKNL